VVARNWRCDAGELDLVVATERVLVFVEVKARATGYFGSPALAVDHRKQQRIRAVATRFMAHTGERRDDLRFDVVAITGTTVEVFEGAF
jgi:putative endonuclease